MKKLMLGFAGLLAVAATFAFQGAGAQGNDTMMKHSGYVEYTEKAYTDASKMKRVLFFAANWCPTCRAADKVFTGKIKDIPADVVVFKTDYDKETALKTKYAITRQHTFVYVDAKGAALKKWSGGDLGELLENTK